MSEKEILKILQETQDFDYENLVKVCKNQAFN